MKPVMDLHTHTIASGHGYSTLKENIEAAQKKGLMALGLSEHGPAIPGGPHIFFFTNYKCIPRTFGNLSLYLGMEANIMDYEGNLDADSHILSMMDYVIASMHTQCCKPGTLEENTKAAIFAMKNPYVTILGHPDDSRYDIDREAVVKSAKQEHVAIEINNSSLNPKSARKNGRNNVKELLDLCKMLKVYVLLGTDSHICYTIGDFTETLNLVKEVDFPKDLILNYDIENLKRILNPCRKI